MLLRHDRYREGGDGQLAAEVEQRNRHGQRKTQRVHRSANETKERRGRAEDPLVRLIDEAASFGQVDCVPKSDEGIVVYRQREAANNPCRDNRDEDSERESVVIAQSKAHRRVRWKIRSGSSRMISIKKRQNPGT